MRSEGGEDAPAIDGGEDDLVRIDELGHAAQEVLHAREACEGHLDLGLVAVDLGEHSALRRVALEHRRPREKL